MLDSLIQIDIAIFRLINSGISNPFFDSIMPFLTNTDNWILVYIFLFGWLLWKGGKKGRILAILLIFSILITDQVCSQLIKEFVGRLRPCRSIDNIILLVDCGPGKSFPSSHAANNFAAAFLLANFYKQYTWVYFSFASLIALSRVYIGVHYPLDIFAGALIGFFIGYLLLSIYKYISNKYSIS